MQLWARNRLDDGEVKLEQVAYAERHYDTQRRKLIILPGADIKDIYPEMFDSEEMFNGKLQDLSGCIKGGEILLGGASVSDLGIDIMAYSHGLDVRMHEEDPKGVMLAHYKNPDKATGTEAKTFVRDILVPMLNEKGQPGTLEEMSAQELSERLDHITFMNHSRGGLFMRCVNNAFREALSRSGYSKEEIADIMPHMVGINVASIARIDEVEEPSATMLHFLATNDCTARNVIGNYAALLSEVEQKQQQRDHMIDTGANFSLDPEHVEATKEKLFKQCGYEGQAHRVKARPISNGIVVRAELPDELQWTECVQDHCDIKFVDRGLSREKDGMDIDHNFRLHSIPGGKNPAYPRMLRNAVIGSVVRDGPISCGQNSKEGCVELLTTQQNSLVRPPLVDYRQHETMPHATREALLDVARASANAINL